MHNYTLYDCIHVFIHIFLYTQKKKYKIKAIIYIEETPSKFAKKEARI
jgi:hypothetical protein